MKNEKKLSALILALLCIGLISGCSKDSQPVSSDPLSQVSLAGSVTSTTTTGMPGIDLRNSKGVFSVDWRRVFHSKQQTTDTTGSAFAIGTDSVRIGLMSTIFIGVDMGKVTLSYGSDSIHLKKVTSFGGRVFYSTAWGWDRDFDDAAKTNVGFVPGGQYQFDVSGSTSFAALTAVVPAPPALVLVSSPAAGDTADITKDLTVSWTGGSSTSSILLRVIPIYKFGHPEIAVHND